MASVLGMLGGKRDDRTCAGGGPAGGSRSDGRGVEAAEMKLDRRVIAREALIVSPAETTAVAESQAKTEQSNSALACIGAGLDGAAVAGRAADDGADLGITSGFWVWSRRATAGQGPSKPGEIAVG